MIRGVPPEREKRSPLYRIEYAYLAAASPSIEPSAAGTKASMISAPSFFDSSLQEIIVYESAFQLHALILSSSSDKAAVEDASIPPVSGREV